MTNHFSVTNPTDFFVLRVEACAGTVWMYGCGNSGALAPASYAKVANQILGGGFTGYTKSDLGLATWPCSVGGETSACGTALYSACLAKCEATTPPCHEFSVEYKSTAGITFGSPTPCRVCNAGNGDACPTYEAAWVGGVGKCDFMNRVAFCANLFFSRLFDLPP